jgi:transposase
VRLVFEAGRPIAQVARELGVNEGTLGNWCATARRRRDGGDAALTESERAELVRLRRENTELRMQREVSSARWRSGSTRRWAGSGGRLHRRPEGRASSAARRRVPGAAGQPGVVLQVARREPLAALRPTGAFRAPSRQRAARHASLLP